MKTVDPATFVGKIQAKTGLNFDLPTEAQWEYACRAGTSSKYNNGGDDGGDWSTPGNKDVSVLARCWTDQSVAVGLYLPNFWGLYDMHGNVGQWCLDYSDGYNSDPAIDYAGAESGSARVIRGYYRYDHYYNATSFYRYGDAPSSNGSYYGFNTYLGFRLSGTLAE
ncbi:MAG: formylglycine-generating enzyme family protein [Kiritimatiellia bacterium]